MNALVIYDSAFGNTQLIARAIAYRLGGAPLVRAHDAGLLEFDRPDLLVVGGPTHIHGMSLTMRLCLAGLPRETLLGLPVAAFDTRYTGELQSTGSAAQQIAHKLEGHGAHLVVPPESFIITGMKGPLVDGEIERAADWVATILARLVTAGALLVEPARLAAKA